MRENEIIKNLQKDIVVPQVVQRKADQMFAQIKEDSGLNKRKHYRNMTWRSVRIAAACAMLVCGTVTVCAAAYMHWSSGMEAEFQATQEQKIFLEE